MKLRTLFFLLIFPLVSIGQNLPQITTKRTLYYNAGLAASIKHFDSLLNVLIVNRYKGKPDEAAFLKEYNFYEDLYRNQQQKVAGLAEKWSFFSKDQTSKNINNALNLLTKGQLSLAISSFELKLKNRNPEGSYKNDFIFLAELHAFKGDFPKAAAIYQKIILSPGSDASDFLHVAETGNFIFGNSSLELPGYAQTDTIFLIRAKIEDSKRYALQGNINEAKAKLIEAQYLTDKFSVKDTIQKNLAATVFYQLGNLQEQSNDFENALNNNKAGAEVYQTLGDKPGYAAILRSQGIIYHRAGANDKAEIAYQACLMEYELLMKQFPERYEPLYAIALEEYNEVLKWYDRYDPYEKNLRKLAEIRKQLMQTKYPFFAMDYARTIDILGQKLLDVNLKIFLAEEQWFIARDVLVALNDKNIMIAGDFLCKVLYKVGGVKISLKEHKEAIPSFSQSLKVRDNLFKLAPLKNKPDLMNLLFQNAQLNNIANVDIELTVAHLNRAKLLADELGEVKLSEEITVYTIGVLKKL
ncbi:MAG: tetratricopeptide repeat protein [Chitinophagaceae bacterium]|jgi:tetratricopeptide (TPR) repeat protein